MEAKDHSTAYVGPGEGRSLWVLGELVTYKVTSKQTGGAYSLFEVASRAGHGPRPHIQHREDECFYVLEGEYEFLEEGRVTRAGIGSLIYVPRGNLHTYRDVGEVPGRMLVSQTPGGLHERLFEELGEPVTTKSKASLLKGPPDVERIATKYGIEIPPFPEAGRRIETRPKGGDDR